MEKTDYWELQRSTLRIYPTPVVAEIGTFNEEILALNLSNPISKAILYWGEQDTYWANRYLRTAIASMAFYPKHDLWVNIVSDDVLAWEAMERLENYEIYYRRDLEWLVRDFNNVLNERRMKGSGPQTQLLVIEDYQDLYVQTNELLKPLLILGAFYNLRVFASSTIKLPYFKTVFQANVAGQLDFIEGDESGLVVKIIEEDDAEEDDTGTEDDELPGE